MMKERSTCSCSIVQLKLTSGCDPESLFWRKKQPTMHVLLKKISWNCIFSSEDAGNTVPLRLRSPSRKAGKFYEVDCSKLKTKSIEKSQVSALKQTEETPWCVKITLIWYSKRQDTSVIWRGDLPMLKDTTVTSSLH